LEEISKLIGGDEGKGKTFEPSGHVAVTILAPTTDSSKQA